MIQPYYVHARRILHDMHPTHSRVISYDGGDRGLKIMKTRVQPYTGRGGFVSTVVELCSQGRSALPTTFAMGAQLAYKCGGMYRQVTRDVDEFWSKHVVFLFL